MGESDAREAARRTPLGLPRLSVASVRGLHSGDLPTLWLAGAPYSYPLTPTFCGGCDVPVLVVRVPGVRGARCDVWLGDGWFYLTAHCCEGRGGGCASTTPMPIG